MCTVFGKKYLGLCEKMLTEVCSVMCVKISNNTVPCSKSLAFCDEIYHRIKSDNY